MSRLLRDRYAVIDDGHAWDLATGQAVDIGSLSDDASSRPLRALAEGLDHGREGGPRSITVVASASDVAAVTKRAAADAAHRGFVPIAVSTYVRLREAL